MTDIFIDCETKPTSAQWFADDIVITPPGQYKKPESIQKWLEENEASERQKIIDKTAVDTSLAEIICICYAADDGLVVEITGETEKDILAEFFAFGLPGNRKSRLVGHNILGFDIPLIYHRAIVNGLRPSHAFHMHYKPWDNNLVFDTMVEWCGIRDRISQHRLAKLLGIPTQDVDGSQIPELYAAGKIDEIAAKCRFDVEQNRQIFKRMTGNG